MKVIIFSFFILLSFECESVKSKSLTQEPCFTDRKVTEEIANIKVTCIEMGDQFILQETDGPRRFAVCNELDDQLIDSLNYLVSGICYEIKPNERWPGTPFQVTKISRLE